MKRVALYARVSGDKQEREETIDSQLEHLRELAAEKGLTILERHVYLDEAYSGALLARPGLDRLRDDARDGLVDVVLVHCPDRLARRYAYQVVVIEELQKYGCEVDFVNREIARTPEDQMLLAMQGVIAEYERAKIMERTRRGRLYKLQTGLLIAPRPPFGYRWIPRQGGERGHVEIVPEHAELVRQIYRWIAEEGLTILAVTRRLIQSRTPAPNGGVRWGTSTIQNMLCNRAYVGEFCFNRVMAVESTQPSKPGIYRRRRLTSARRRPPDEWIVVPGPAIIDRQLFDTVQKRLAENKRFALRRASHEHQMLLRCLLRCGCCGYSLIATWSKPRPPNGAVFRYYCCLRRAQHTRYGDCVTKCSLPPLKADILDDVVWNDLRAVMSDPARIARHAGLEPDTTPKRLKLEVEHLTREIKGCDRQMQRLVDAYQRGAVEMEDLLRRRKAIDGRKGILADSLKQAEAALHDDQVRRDIRAQLPDFVSQVTASLDSAEFYTRQRLVRLLIDRVVIHPNLEVEIHYVLAALGRLGDPPPESPVENRVASGSDSTLSSDIRLCSDRKPDLAVRHALRALCPASRGRQAPSVSLRRHRRRKPPDPARPVLPERRPGLPARLPAPSGRGARPARPPLCRQRQGLSLHPARPHRRLPWHPRRTHAAVRAPGPRQGGTLVPHGEGAVPRQPRSQAHAHNRGSQYPLLGMDRQRLPLVRPQLSGDYPAPALATRHRAHPTDPASHRRAAAVLLPADPHGAPRLDLSAQCPLLRSPRSSRRPANRDSLRPPGASRGRCLPGRPARRPGPACGPGR